GGGHRSAHRYCSLYVLIRSLPLSQVGSRLRSRAGASVTPWRHSGKHTHSKKMGAPSGGTKSECLAQIAIHFSTIGRSKSNGGEKGTPAILPKSPGNAGVSNRAKHALCT